MLRTVETDGSSLVAVQRGGLDLAKHRNARELAIADNRVSKIDLVWNIRLGIVKSAGVKAVRAILRRNITGLRKAKTRTG